MNYDPNSKEEIAKRKTGDMVKLCGAGIVLFAFWNIVKFLLQIITESDAIFGNTEMQIRIVATAMVVVLMIIDSALRIYVWRCAVREGNGGEPHNAHIVIAVILVIIDIVANLVNVGKSFSWSLLIETIIDLTSELVLVDLVVETFKLRKLNKITNEMGD